MSEKVRFSTARSIKRNTTEVLRAQALQVLSQVKMKHIILRTQTKSTSRKVHTLRRKAKKLKKRKEERPLLRYLVVP